MDQLIQSVLDALPAEQSSVERLRERHIGSLLSAEALERCGFTIRTQGNGTFCSCTLCGGALRVSLDLRPLGGLDGMAILCRLRLAERINAEDSGGLGPASGWYLRDDVGSDVESALVQVLSTVTVQPQPTDPEDLWKSFADAYTSDDLKRTADPDPAYILCCIANHKAATGTDKMTASLLASSLMRGIDGISRGDVLGDLPHLCGQLWLRGECGRAVRRLLDPGVEVTAEAWCNTGAALCDGLRLPRPALECFRHSIRMNPRLSPPRQSVWVAGKWVIAEMTAEKDFNGALSIGQEVEKLGSQADVDHGFYSYLALAHEALGDVEQAQKRFGQALRIDPGCALSRSGLDRLTGRNASPDNGLDLCLMMVRLDLDNWGYVSDQPDVW